MEIIALHQSAVTTKMAERSQEDIMELITFLREQGAVMIRVGDVKAVFPPPIELSQPVELDEPQSGAEPTLRDWVNYRPLPKVR